MPTRSNAYARSLAHSNAGFACHVLACLWVMVGRHGSFHGKDNWLAHQRCTDDDDDDDDGYDDGEETFLGGPGYDESSSGGVILDCDWGPFTYRDTTGGPQVATIYLSAFYFCLTSMTSVGFGDITGRNDDERVFSVVLEFIGAGVLATCVASMTAVVTAQDMNSRKTAEQLDAVASFVISKNFPENLGRRIRRHFRHVYSIKTAIDESKIFTELSTSLRAEVSAYLLENKMGQVTLFRSMSRTLWPRL